MTTVEQAEQLILAEAGDYGNEIIPFDHALGRVLAENIKADRDMPPFNRVTMDGIAINYNAFEQGIREFKIKATQAAGEQPIDIIEQTECIEIMTGAVLAASTDTVIRYEDLDINDGIAILTTDEIKRGQNLHLQGADRVKGELMLTPGKMITPAIISLIASVGETEIRVKRIPRVVVISSGDELVEVGATPLPFQIRKSNSYTIQAVLKKHGIESGMVHIPDDLEATKQALIQCLHNYDVILLSGGISMGKFDYIPQALKELQVSQIFHKVAQRPGKPFWFGKHDNGVLVFAFPGNPVATFMCLHRYFIPWLRKTLSMDCKPPAYAVLTEDFTFTPELEYFLQVSLNFSDQGQLLAKPIAGNGSGDFANLAGTDAFMELPLQKANFKKGEVYKTWPF